MGIPVVAVTDMVWAGFVCFIDVPSADWCDGNLERYVHNEAQIVTSSSLVSSHRGRLGDEADKSFPVFARLVTVLHRCGLVS